MACMNMNMQQSATSFIFFFFHFKELKTYFDWIWLDLIDEHETRCVIIIYWW